MITLRKPLPPGGVRIASAPNGAVVTGDWGPGDVGLETVTLKPKETHVVRMDQAAVLILIQNLLLCSGPYTTAQAEELLRKIRVTLETPRRRRDP